MTEMKPRRDLLQMLWRQPFVLPRSPQLRIVFGARTQLSPGTPWGQPDPDQAPAPKRIGTMPGTRRAYSSYSAPN